MALQAATTITSTGLHSHPAPASASASPSLALGRPSSCSYGFLASNSLLISSSSSSPSLSYYPKRIGSSRKALSGSNGVSVRASSQKVLIVNTNSGGHSVIGFWLVKELLSLGHKVTIFTVGEESSDKMKKPPFSRFSVSIH